jgi:hypothetical protein
MCLLLLVGWCGEFCTALESEELAAYVVLALFLCLFCLFERKSACAVLNFDQRHIAQRKSRLDLTKRFWHILICYVVVCLDLCKYASQI